MQPDLQEWFEGTEDEGPDERLRYAWQFDGIDDYLYTTDALPTAIGGSRALTMMVRSRAVAVPGATKQLCTVGATGGASTGFYLQSNSFGGVGRNPSTAQTWLSGPNMHSIDTDYRTYVAVFDATGANEEQAFFRHTLGGTTSKEVRTSATKLTTISVNIGGLGARVTQTYQASQWWAGRVYEWVIWERALSDAEVHAAINAGRGRSLAWSNPATWLRPSPGVATTLNRGYLGGELKTRPETARQPLIVPDGPDRVIERRAVSEVARQSTTETGSSETLQGGARGNGFSVGTGPWSGGVPSANFYAHKYTTENFTPHEDSNGPLGSGIYLLRTSDVTSAGDVDHCGDADIIPDDGSVHATLRGKVAVPWLSGAGSGHGIVSLHDPVTFATDPTEVWRTDTLFGATFGYLDGVCYWRRDLPYSGSEEGLLVTANTKMFVTDLQDASPSVLREWYTGASYSLVEGVKQLPAPDFVLGSVAFADMVGDRPNGIYLWDVWDGTLQPVRFWQPPVPPVGHYEGIALADDAGEFWHGEGVNAVRYLAAGLHEVTDATKYKPAP